MSARALRVALTATMLGATLALASCSIIPLPPSAQPTDLVPSIEPSGLSFEELDSPLGFTFEQRAAVRIRNLGCDGMSSGSGFILDAHTIITNHHVVASTGGLQVTLSDGTDITVASSRYSTRGDLALIPTVESIGPWVPTESVDASPGAKITVVGYPHGDALDVATGTIIIATKDTLGNAPSVWATSAKVAPGSSGSAVYDTDGAVIGVVYAGDEASGESYVIPVSLLTEFLTTPELQVDNPIACTPDWL